MAVILALVVAALRVPVGLWVFEDPHHATSPVHEIALTCPESVGQQGRGNEVVIGGVEGLVLPESGKPSSLTSIVGPGKKKYYIYKVYLAVSASDAPFAKVLIVKPTTARLYYGFPLGYQALIRASKRQVRLPVCGPRFTGYAGGMVLVSPSRVTFQVTTPSRHADRIEVSIGNG